MTNELKQKILNEISKLPENKKVAINSIDWIGILDNICKDFNLIDEEIEAIQIETTLVLINMVDVNFFYEKIEENANLTEDQAKAISIKIIEKILDPIANKIDNSKEIKTITYKKQDNRDYKEKILEIGKKYKLPIDQMGEIENITTQYINGGMSSIQYEDKLSLITDFHSTKIAEIINDINENIINDIHDRIIKTDKKETIISKNTDEGIPLPPYAKVTNNYQAQNTEYYKMEEKEIIPEIAPSTNETNQTYENEINLYKNQGIEILSENEIKNNNSTAKKDDIKESINPIGSIIANKLINKTSSKTTVTDYSLPKISTKPSISTDLIQNISNKHDPYHEQI